MAQIGLSEAARLTGRNQTTIHRAMKAGRLSYTVSAAGERQIDTAELDRVFGIKASSETEKVNGASLDASAHGMQSHVTHEPESERVIAAQAETIAQMDAMIRDLRARLDHEAAERRQLSERLHGLLTAKPSGSGQFIGSDVQAGEPTAAKGSVPSVSSPAPAGSVDLHNSTSPLAGFRPRWWRRWLR
jgi:hypothetical protein